jgi:hypothetical protein
MPRQLLSLALTVDLHDGGNYLWRILESFDHLGDYETLLASSVSFQTYASALTAGCEALKRLCDDPLVGPVDEEASNDEDYA